MTVLACDFGGRRIKLGVVHEGQVLASTVLPARSDQPLAKRLPDVARAFCELLRGHSIARDDCRGIGISYPSIIDPASGQILDEFGKFGPVSSEDLRAWAAAEFGLRLVIENDARMALIGEWRYGGGRGCNNLAIMMLGTGLGAAAVMEGRPLRGRHGMAGILGGHLAVQYDGRPCVCGNRGCAEAEASTSVLADIARQSPGFHESPLSRETELSYEAVFRRAAEGDPCAIHLQERSLKIWSTMAVNLIHVYDPELLLLGGGIMGSAAVVLPAIAQWVRSYAHTPWGQVRVAASRLGDHVALVAAEWLVEEQLARDRKSVV
jgi:glucokinase